MRRMDAAGFRRLEPGVELQVVINNEAEVQNLRSAASRAERREGCVFRVSYSRGADYAVVRREERRGERDDTK